MNYNNSTNTQSLHSLLHIVFALCLITSAIAAHHKSKLLEDLPQIKITHQNNSWQTNLNIAHHTLQLTPKILPCRSWIKSSQCKICDQNGQNCDNDKTCYVSEKEPKVSCDSSYCQKGTQFADAERSIYGFEAEVFGKLGSEEQTLIPLVFASKLSKTLTTNGEFCLLDSESSFSQGLMQLKNKTIEVINTKANAVEGSAVRESSIATFAIKMDSSQIGLHAFTSNSVAVVNSQPLAYRQITYNSPNGFKIQLSLQQVGITVPLKMLHQLQAGISSTYFPTNKCRFSVGKIKCMEQLNFGGFTEAMLEFRFPSQNFNLSLPLHMLIGSCASKTCNFLLDSHDSSDIVILGSIFLEAMAFEWDLDAKKMWFHRLNNQWADPYRAYKIDPNKKGFLVNMFTLLFHIVLYMIYSILALAAISLAINCLMRWKEVLAYLKSIGRRLMMGRKKGMSAIQEQEYFVDAPVGEAQVGRRKINRLQDLIQDQL